MIMISPMRSVLYMPAANPRVLEKARSLPADAIIFDLEDAVAPDLKTDARKRACDAVRTGAYGRRTVVVRINGVDTPWGEEDLAAVSDASPDAILVPKINTAEEVADLSRTIAAGNAHTKLWVMVETPLAVLNIAAIAAAGMAPHSRLTCLVLGTNDLAKETGARITPGRASLTPWLSQAVCAARAYGLAVLDGVYNDFADAAGLEAECRHGRDLGMDGKTLIHPGQIDICNEVFSPSAEDLARARRIAGEFDRPENAAVNVLSIDGQMVERLHADMARRTIAIAEAIALA